MNTRDETYYKKVVEIVKDCNKVETSMNTRDRIAEIIVKYHHEAYKSLMNGEKDYPTVFDFADEILAIPTGREIHPAGLCLPQSLQGEELAWAINREKDRTKPRPETLGDIAQ